MKKSLPDGCVLFGVACDGTELLTVRIVRISTGSVFVETEVDFPPRSSVTSVGGETFAASLEAEPAAVFSTSPTLLSYGPAAANVELSVTEIPDEATEPTEGPAPTEPTATEDPNGMPPSATTAPSDDDTTSSPTPTPITTPAPTPDEDSDPSDGHRTATLMPYRHLLLALGMQAVLLLFL